MLKWLWLSVAVLVADQVTKLWVVAVFELYESVEIIPFLNLTYVQNKGAAFSFLSTAGGWQRWFLTGIAVIAIGVLVVWLRRLKAEEKLLAISMSLVLGGAIGNLYDRIAYGYVIDFIDAHYQGMHWPVFNVADSAIFIGVVLMLIEMFTGSDKKQSPESGI
jgi:signal peptidase II